MKQSSQHADRSKGETTDASGAHARAYNGIQLAWLALLQWPLAVTVIDGLNVVDGVACAMLLGALVAWFCKAPPKLTGAIILGAAAAATLGAFLGLRDQSLGAFLAIAVAIWILAVLYAFRRKRYAAARVAMVVTVLCVGVTTAEMMPLTFDSAPQPRITRSGKFTTRSVDAYKTLLPSSKARHMVVSPTGETVFEVEYTVDNNGSRHVPGRPETGWPLMLFGGSHTFGNGLADEATIAAYLQRKNPDARVYNFGVPWCGTGDAYFHMKHKLAEVAPPKWSVYFFIDDHMTRTAVPDFFYALYGHDERPCFALDPELVYIGTVKQRVSRYSRLRQLHFNLLKRSQRYRAVLAGSWRPGPHEVELVVALATEMREMTKDAGGRFLFVIVPQNAQGGPEPLRVAEIKAKLEDRQVLVLDCQSLMTEHWKDSSDDPAQYFFPFDGHPTEKYARFVAAQVDSFIKRFDAEQNTLDMDSLSISNDHDSESALDIAGSAKLSSSNH